MALELTLGLTLALPCVEDTIRAPGAEALDGMMRRNAALHGEIKEIREGNPVLAETKLMAFVPTRDAEKARAFYVDTLGLKFLEDDSFAVMVEAAGIKVRLVRIANHAPARFTILGWEVADIEKSVSEMAERGVEFERYGMPGQGANGIWSSPGGSKIAWFCDPDGNVLSLSQLA